MTTDIVTPTPAIPPQPDKRIEEMTTLRNSGLAALEQGNAEGALRYYEQALALARETGDRSAEGDALIGLSNAHSAMNQYEQAQRNLEQVVTIRHDTGDQLGEAITLNELGHLAEVRGNTQEAVALNERALAIHHRISNPIGEGGSLFALGGLAARAGHSQEAIAYYERAIATLESINAGDRESAATVQGLIAMIRGEIKDLKPRRWFWQR